jgi:hypothetical protein
MDEVVAEGYLVLVLSLIKVLVEHLDEGLLRVELALVVLRVDIDLVLQLLRLGYPHDLAPIGQQLLLVESNDLLLVFDLRP